LNGQVIRTYPSKGLAVKMQMGNSHALGRLCYVTQISAHLKP
jgi:hypothetical protein